MTRTAPLYTVDEVAAIFGIHPITVKRRIVGDSPDWPSTKIGGRRRFTQEHLDQIIAMGEQPAITAQVTRRSRRRAA